MAESDLSGARARIVVVERRLAALQDLGLDVAVLRTQLGQARSHVEQGAAEDAQALCDEVAEAARRLAASASRTSGDWRGLPKAQLLDELRRVLGEGAAGELMAERERALRDEFEAKHRDFERRLRDQFAREMAQVLSARPWMKDVQSATPGAEDITVLRQELAALKASPIVSADQVRQLIAEAQLSHSASPGAGLSTSALAELRREIEALRAEPRPALSTAQIHSMVVRIVEARTPKSADGHAGDEELRKLVAESAALQARLGERLLGLESRIVSAVDPQHKIQTTAAPNAAGEMAWPFPGEDSGRRAELEGTALAQAQSAPTTPLSSTPPKSAPRVQAVETTDDSDDSSRVGAVPSMAMPNQEPLTAAISVAIRPPADAASGVDISLIKRLIDQRLASQGNSSSNGLAPDDAAQERQLIRLLPGVMRDPVVRAALFAAFALEATAHPGALGELTGLRTFLRKELTLALDGLRRELGVGVG